MAKKSFKQTMAQNSTTVAMSYISSGASEDAGEKETKSKRLNLLIRPSLFEAASKIATMRRISVNELLNKTLEELVAGEANTIEMYDKIFGEGE